MPIAWATRINNARVYSCSHISPPSPLRRSACGPLYSLGCPSPSTFKTGGNEASPAERRPSRPVGGTGPIGASALREPQDDPRILAGRLVNRTRAATSSFPIIRV